MLWRETEMKNVFDQLRLKQLENLAGEPFGENRISQHTEIQDSKKAFKTLATDIHLELLSLVKKFDMSDRPHPICEIGAGVIPLSSLSERVISSDLVHNTNLDLQFNAESMPFGSESLNAIIGQNVFHHFTNYQKVLTEMQRVLVPGGVIVLLEPSFNWISKIIYPRLFSFEGFDLKADPMCILLNKDSEVVPNQALSWIVFNRELKNFENEFPKLEIVERLQLPNGIRYLGTVCLNFKQILPTCVLGVLRKFEKISMFSPLLRRFALHWVVVIRMKSIPIHALDQHVTDLPK
jgi:SAM-dependent methyltransferase